MGYDWDAHVYNAADYGGYTKRERLIVRAVRDGVLPPLPKKLPESERPKGWMDAVKDLIPTLPEKKSGVPKWMDERLKAEGIDWRHIDKPLYVFGQGNSATSVPHAFADELLPTLRTKGGDVIIMPDGRVLRATPRVLARVTGLADDYKMPITDDMAHTIIGNGIPTQMSEHVIGPLLEDVFNGGEKATDESLITQRRQENVFASGEEQRESKRTVTLEMDKAYMDAVEKGDMETAQRMVNEAAEKAGYANDESWKMLHEAPNSKDDFNKSLDDVSEMFPGIYGDKAYRYYGHMGTGSYESIGIIRKVQGNPNAMVTIYRAVPKSVKEGKVRNGDWVTLSEDYARDHGLMNLDNYRIIKEEVPAKYLYTDGNSVNEFGYDDGSSYAYRNTKNNRKLLDPVTYDDNGNVIPLSQRFNMRTDDVRHSKRSETMFKNVDSEDLKAINTRFNEELQQQIDGKFKGIHVYQLGNPSEALLHAGFEDLPLEVTSRTLDLKSSPLYKSNHPFSLDMVRDLPMAIQRPIAVFDSEYEEGRKVVMTELKNADGKNFLAVMGVMNKKGRNHIQVYDVITLYGKDSNARIAKWFDSRNKNGLGLDVDLCQWADTKKASEWLANNASTVHWIGLSSKRIANVIKSFEDYQYPDENNSEIEEKASKRGTPNLNLDVLNSAQQIYEESLKGYRSEWDEAWHDSLVSVKRLQEALAEVRGTDLKDFENVYWHAVTLSSVTAAEQSELLNKYIQPLMDTVKDLCKKHGMTQDDLEVYLNCKHGLERNQLMAEREAAQTAERNKEKNAKAAKLFADGKMEEDAYNDYVAKHPEDSAVILEKLRRKRDYSGLTDIFNPKNKMGAYLKHAS